MIDDEETRRKSPAHVVGQDISALSIEEIGRRIEELGAEIERLESARSAKQAVKGAADALFRKMD